MANSVLLLRTTGVWERMHKHGSIAASGAVEFWQLDEDTGGRLRTLKLDRTSWEDMGSPEGLTITIEPGDHLNDE